jgi:endonuclease YncB( thermonuclease family)
MEISNIYETALNDGSENWNRSLLTSNWKIGERIFTEEQGGNERAPYGNQVLKQLSTDLNRKYSRGFSMRNLAYMRSFYQTYNLQKIKPAISWSNYRLLLTVDDIELRKTLENQIMKEGLTSLELQNLIKRKTKRFVKQDKANESQKHLLKRPTLGLFTYRIALGGSLNSAHAVQNIDLGFRVKYELDDKLKLDKFKPGSIVTVEKTKRGFQIKKSASVRELFTYKAYLNRIIDGDTMIVHIDLGFSVFIEQRLRLRGLDSPELSEKGGQASKRLIESSLKDSPFLIIKTHGTDLYDRYLVDVFYLPNEWSEEKIINEGNHLNNRLLEEGLAERI